MKSRVWMVAGLAAAAAAAPLSAVEEEKFFDNYCVMGSLQVCASVRVFSEGNTLRMKVWNLEGTLGTSYTMTSIGLYQLGNPWLNSGGKVLSYSVDWNGTNITS